MTEIDIHTHTALSDAEAVVRHADGGLDDATKPATGFTRQLNAGVAERLGIDLDDARTPNMRWPAHTWYVRLTRWRSWTTRGDRCGMCASSIS